MLFELPTRLIGTPSWYASFLVDCSVVLGDFSSIILSGSFLEGDIVRSVISLMLKSL